MKNSKYGMGGNFISPDIELKFGGPAKYRDGNELEGLGPETTYADQIGISPDDPLYDYLNQFGQQNIEVDTKTWLDLVGLLSGAKAGISGGGPVQAMVEQIGSKGLRMAKDYLMEKFGVSPEVVEQSVASGQPVPELAPGTSPQGALPSGASNMQLPGGSAPAAAGRRANALQRLSNNELPSSGDLFIGHPGTQTRNALGQYGPNSASGVSTSGQRLPSVRNTQVAVRPNTSTDMLPFSPSGGNLPAVRPNSNTGVAPIGSGTVLSETGVSPRLGSVTRAGIIGTQETTDIERPGRPSPFTSVFPEQIQGYSDREPENIPKPNPSPNPSPNPNKSSGSSEFNQAFRAARHRGDMVFEWNGKSYGTRRKGETNEEHRMAMDQVRIKSRGAEMRNNPPLESLSMVEPAKEVSFNSPSPQLSPTQRTVPAAAPKPKSSPAPTGRKKIQANRQENKSIRQGLRQERKDNRQASRAERQDSRNSKNADRRQNRAGRLEDRAAKLRGNSKPAATSNKAKEDKAMSQINAAANRPMKDGGKKEMIKRADGSTSQRGLWDNIRANKGSGKKPTKEMLKQEKKIKAESKKDGGLKTPTNKGLKKLPKNVRNKMGFKKEGGLKDRRK